MKLLNVRLDEADVDRVRALRARNVPISRLVRDAIRAEYKRSTNIRAASDIDKILAEIYEKYPAPTSTGPDREFAPHDRRQFREAMQAHVRRRR